MSDIDMLCGITKEWNLYFTKTWKQQIQSELKTPHNKELW